MSWNGKNTMMATVAERGFTLESSGREVPGVYWTPVGADPNALVLLGHGATGDKKSDYIELIAHGLCSMGIAAMAIDGPGHGDRPGASQWANSGTSTFRDRWESDGGTAGAVQDWKAALDFIEDVGDVRITGWLGLSMGTMMGLPVCVADERISVAVLGLMGLWGPGHDDMARFAPELSIPVRFLVQWDDEIVPRDSCFELFEVLGSETKSMHANPGQHGDVPRFEIEDAVVFLDKQMAELR